MPKARQRRPEARYFTVLRYLLSPDMLSLSDWDVSFEFWISDQTLGSALRSPAWLLCMHSVARPQSKLSWSGSVIEKDDCFLLSSKVIFSLGFWRPLEMASVEYYCNATPIRNSDYDSSIFIDTLDVHESLRTLWQHKKLWSATAIKG